MVEVTPQVPLLEFQCVNKSFTPSRKSRPIQVLDNITFDIPHHPAGGFIALLGPSGSGKSTILNLISGMIQPDSGSIRVLGEKVTPTNHKSVTVPQAYTCYPWRTVRGNVEFGLEIRGINAERRHDLATEYLRKVGLLNREFAYPRELSGGMQQRVAIARALVLQPPVVLMDEPFGALDPRTRREMQEMLVGLWEEEKSLIFFVTHDIREALFTAQRVIILGDSPTTILAEITVPFSRPRTLDLTTNPRFVELFLEIERLFSKDE